MSKNIWAGLAIGAVIGGGLGEDVPSGNNNDGGLGGAKNFNDDRDSGNGGQGLFSLWGHDVWLYVGGIIGLGDKAGVYLTTGPMIGANPDWAVGGGIHLAKAFGAGIVIPIRQAVQSYNRHQDKIGAYIDSAQHLLASASHYVTETVNNIPNLVGGLEQAVSRLC